MQERYWVITIWDKYGKLHAVEERVARIKPTRYAIKLAGTMRPSVMEQENKEASYVTYQQFVERLQKQDTN